MYVCECANVYMNVVPTETKSGCWSPGARYKWLWATWLVFLGLNFCPSQKQHGALNHRVISPDPLLPFLIPPPHILPSPIIPLSFSFLLPRFHIWILVIVRLAYFYFPVASLQVIFITYLPSVGGVHVCACVRALCTTVCLWRSVISFNHEAPGDQTQVIGLGTKCIHLLNCLATPFNSFFKNLKVS